MKLLLNPVTGLVTLRSTAGVPAAHQKFCSFLCARLDTNWRLWLFVSSFCSWHKITVRKTFEKRRHYFHILFHVCCFLYVSPSKGSVTLCRRDRCSTLALLYNKHTTKAVPVLMITFLSSVPLSPFLFLNKFCHRSMEIFFYWLPERASINKTSDTSVLLVAIGCN